MFRYCVSTLAKQLPRIYPIATTSTSYTKNKAVVTSTSSILCRGMSSVADVDANAAFDAKWEAYFN